MAKAKEIIVEIDGERHKFVKKSKRSGNVCKVCSVSAYCKGRPICLPFGEYEIGTYFRKTKQRKI